MIGKVIYGVKHDNHAPYVVFGTVKGCRRILRKREYLVADLSNRDQRFR